MDENETDSDLGSWADDISRPPFDLSKNRYGVTREVSVVLFLTRAKADRGNSPPQASKPYAANSKMQA